MECSVPLIRHQAALTGKNIATDWMLHRNIAHVTITADGYIDRNHSYEVSITVAEMPGIIANGNTLIMHHEILTAEELKDVWPAAMIQTKLQHCAKFIKGYADNELHSNMPYWVTFELAALPDEEGEDS